jgi:amino acid transporter
MPSTSPANPRARNPIIVVIGIGGLAAIILTTVLSMMILQRFLNPFDTSTINSIILTVIIVLAAWFIHKKLANV